MQDNLGDLQRQLEEARGRKNKLAKDVEECAARLDRAQRLIGGLGGEKARWSATAALLQATYDSVVGDVLLSAGMIAYLGAFTAAYRERATSSWVALCRERHIPCSEHFK